MTREEAINNVCGIKCDDSFKRAKKAINKIYDDFENRTCESCKYGGMVRYGDNEWHIKCMNDETYQFFNGATFNHCMEVEKDFGCNKWESKNEQT